MSVHNGPNVIENGLVLCLDAGDPRSYPGSGTIWTDRSGLGNNGTLANGVGYNSANRGNLIFGGTNQCIQFNATTQSLGLNTSSGATLSCWLRLTILNRWTGVFTFWGFTPNLGVDFGWDITNNNFLRIHNKQTGPTTSLSLTPYSNMWVYYTLVSDSTSTKFFINGNELVSLSQVGNVTFTSSRTLMFGDHWDASIQGNSNMIHIYNRALSADEIKQNFEATRSRFGI